MKRYIKIMIAVVLSVSFVYSIILKLCPENKDFDVVLEDVIFEDLSDLDIENLNEYSDFYYQRVSDEVVSSVTNNPERFKKISLKFLLRNNSKNIVMEDITVNHKFVSEMEKRVVAYNRKNSDIFLFLYPKGHLNYPQHKTTFDQKILINCEEIECDEIMGLLMDGICEVTYFTGPFSTTNGQEITGVGKHTKCCNLKEITR